MGESGDGFSLDRISKDMTAMGAVLEQHKEQLNKIANAVYGAESTGSSPTSAGGDLSKDPTHMAYEESITRGMNVLWRLIDEVGYQTGRLSKLTG